MLRRAALLLFATMVASPALAQSSQQADLKAQLEAARAPLFRNNQTVPGFTASYSAFPDSCVTHVDVMVPNHSFEGESLAGSVTRKDLNWREVSEVRLSNNYVIVFGPSLRTDGEYFFAVNTQGAQRMKATMDSLRSSCGGATAATNAAIADAQRRFRASIEQSTTLGLRFVTGRNDERCMTKFATAQEGKTDEQVLAEGLWIRWEQANRVAFEPGKPDATAWWRNYVEVSSPSGSWPLHPSPEQVGPMMTAANELIALCKPTAAAPAAAHAPAPAPVPAKRTFQVTASMVTSDPPDAFLRMHYYEMPLTGQAGERYRLSWQGTVPVNLDFSETYDADYPDNSSIFDLSHTVTITLLESGEHVLTFDQVATEYPENQRSNSLAGPSFEGGRPRAFVPFTLTVEKLN